MLICTKWRKKWRSCCLRKGNKRVTKSRNKVNIIDRQQISKNVPNDLKYDTIWNKSNYTQCSR